MLPGYKSISFFISDALKVLTFYPRHFIEMRNEGPLPSRIGSGLSRSDASHEYLYKERVLWASEF